MGEFSNLFFFFQAEDGIRDVAVTGVQTCALPISTDSHRGGRRPPQFRADMPAVFQNVMVTARRRGSPPTTMGIGGALKFSLARTKNQIGRASCRERK